MKSNLRFILRCPGMFSVRHDGRHGFGYLCSMPRIDDNHALAQVIPLNP